VSTLVHRQDHLPPLATPRFRARVVSGANAGLEASSTEGRLVVGSADGADLRLSDPTVSRFHVELEATGDGVLVRDLGSTNGTAIGAVFVREALVAANVALDLGKTRVEVILGGGPPSTAPAPLTAFGGLLGISSAMRAVFLALERAAPTTAPVLITGESGTGKELAARAVHMASPRASGPFEVVDCGGLPPALIESELFGHERGAFTGAAGEREGAFERAEGGTVFLDELGELPLEVQPKLLRVLGEKEIRRVGGRRSKKIDVRIVAATNRDLRREVNAGGFRADLFYRLAVIPIRLPPLRDRKEDIGMLVDALVESIAAERGLDLHVEIDDALRASLVAHTWPGNVRELRNYLEQLLILAAAPPLGEGAVPGAAGPDFEGLLSLPLRAAKAELVERFERHYVERLLEATGENVAEAARRAGVDRVTLFRTIRRHGLRGGS
jgi:two-component system, NtrC family, response regulator GlrR